MGIMKKKQGQNNAVNWIIFKSQHVGTKYGIGTYIENISYGLSKVEEINCYILEMCNNVEEVQVSHEGEITIVKLPIDYSYFLYDNNEVQQIIIELLAEFVNLNQVTVIHLNYFFEIPIFEKIKQLSANVYSVFTFHIACKEKIIEFVNVNVLDYVICPSNYVANKFSQYCNLFNNINVIRNGLIDSLKHQYSEEDLTKIYEEFNLNPDIPIVLFNGRVCYQKGVHFLIQSIKQLRSDVQVVIAGGGDFEEFDSLLIGIEHQVIFTGLLPTSELRKLYAITKIGVNVSINDNAPYSVIEMFENSIPVIVSDVGGLPEMVVHNYNGFVVNTELHQGDRVPVVSELTNYIDILINNSTKHKEMSEAARSYFEREYRIENTVERMLSLI